MADCSCVYIGDFDSPSSYEECMLTAIVTHECIECGKVIEVGDRYERVDGTWNGYSKNPYSAVYRTCSTCLDIRRAFFCDGWLFCGMFEALHEHLFETSGEVHEDCIADLTPMARDIVCDMIEELWNGED